jgi:hypothetical protein
MKVYWDKDFYEKYHEIFNIGVWAKKEERSGNYNTCGYTFSTLSSHDVPLDLSFGWKEENGTIVLGQNTGICETFPIKDVYMVIPDELMDIFPDLKPWLDFSTSITWSSWS